MRSARSARLRFAGGDVDNWQAYAINAQSPAPVPWDADALFAYLREGWHPDHGIARGPMAEVVEQSVDPCRTSDVRAIATYMADVFGAPTPDRKRQGDDGAGAGASRARPTSCDSESPAAAIYAAACATCHDSDRPPPYGGINLGAQHDDQRSRPAQRSPTSCLPASVRSRASAARSCRALPTSMSDDADRRAAELSACALQPQPPGATSKISSRKRGAPRLPISRLRPRTQRPGRCHHSETSHDDIEGQWSGPSGRRRSGYAAALRAARRSRAQRRQVRLRPRPVRRLHGDRRRQGGALLRDADGCCWRASRSRRSKASAPIETPAPIQRAFIEEQAAQCGYCIAGMMMRAQALLQTQSQADRRADPRRAGAAICAAAARICASCARCIAPARLMDTAELAPAGRRSAQ